jgi:hypothetical protein
MTANFGDFFLFSAQKFLKTNVVIIFVNTKIAAF